MFAKFLKNYLCLRLNSGINGGGKNKKLKKETWYSPLRVVLKTKTNSPPLFCSIFASTSRGPSTLTLMASGSTWYPSWSRGSIGSTTRVGLMVVMVWLGGSLWIFLIVFVDALFVRARMLFHLSFTLVWCITEWERLIWLPSVAYFKVEGCCLGVDAWQRGRKFEKERSTFTMWKNQRKITYFLASKER